MVAANRSQPGLICSARQRVGRWSFEGTNPVVAARSEVNVPYIQGGTIRVCIEKILWNAKLTLPMWFTWATISTTCLASRWLVGRWRWLIPCLVAR